jgi:hypothetical protein
MTQTVYRVESAQRSWWIGKEVEKWLSFFVGARYEDQRLRKIDKAMI